ncbi:MAG: DUF4384 domain-containing protein [Gemmatimonadales bacterium]
MLSALLFSLLAPATGLGATAAPAAVQESDPPVKVWISERDAHLGDEVKTYVRTESDGYLVVLHAEPDGRVRVLFPLDPNDDNFIRGGKKYELRGRGDRKSFTVYASEGIGTVYAAFSRDPFKFDGLVRGNHWDYTLEDTWRVDDDDEAELTDLALRLASGAYFDYDLDQYEVEQPRTAVAEHRYHLSLYDPYYPPYGYRGTRLGFTVLYGPGYTYARRHYLLHRPYYGGHGFTFGIGFGFGGYDPYHYDPFFYDPFFHDPFFYDPFFYDPFFYGSSFGFGRHSGFGFGHRGTVFVETIPRLRPTRIRPTVSSGQSGRRVFTKANRRSGVGSRSAVSPTRRRSAIARRHTSVTPAKRASGVRVRRRSVQISGRSEGQRLDASPGRRTATPSQGRPSTSAAPARSGRRVASSSQRTRPDAARPSRRSVESRGTTAAPRTARRSVRPREATAAPRPRTARRSKPTVRTRSRAVSRPRINSNRGSSVQSRRTFQLKRRAVTTGRSARRSGPTRISRPSARTSRPSVRRSSPSRARSRAVSVRSRTARSSGSRRRKP